MLVFDGYGSGILVLALALVVAWALHRVFELTEPHAGATTFRVSGLSRRTPRPDLLRLVRTLRRIAGVDTLSASRTGVVKIRHHGAFDPSHVLRALRQLGYFAQVAR